VDPGGGRALDRGLRRTRPPADRALRQGTPGGEAQVEVELGDGSLLPLESIIPEPGFGFVTLRPHSRRREEIVIPVSAISRLRLSPPEEHQPFGFSKLGGDG
jgi:hypothetical protein